MKVYTKTGDKGETSLFGGKRVVKCHVRINAYGTSDELNSWMGLIRDQEVSAVHKERILDIQDRLYTLGAQLAADPDKPKLKMPHVKEDDIRNLEAWMDEMDAELPPMKNFTYPGGHTTVSYCHIARTICRRCERLVIEMNQTEDVPELVIQYLNRLSDFLFVLSRKLTQELNVQEKFWIPKL